MEDSCGVAFMHGESVFPATALELAGLRLVWDALEEFGIDDEGTAWLPYWRNPRSRYPDGVIVSSWLRKDAELLAVFNPSYADAAELPPSLFEGLSGIHDEIGTARGDLTRLKPRGFLLLKGNRMESDNPRR